MDHALYSEDMLYYSYGNVHSAGQQSTMVMDLRHEAQAQLNGAPMYAAHSQSDDGYMSQSPEVLTMQSELRRDHFGPSVASIGISRNMQHGFMEQFRNIILCSGLSPRQLTVLWQIVESMCDSHTVMHVQLERAVTDSSSIIVYSTDCAQHPAVVEGMNAPSVSMGGSMSNSGSSPLQHRTKSNDSQAWPTDHGRGVLTDVAEGELPPSQTPVTFPPPPSMQTTHYPAWHHDCNAENVDAVANPPLFDIVQAPISSPDGSSAVGESFTCLWQGCNHHFTGRVTDSNVAAHIKEFHFSRETMSSGPGERVLCQWETCRKYIRYGNLGKHVAGTHMRLKRVSCEECGQELCRSDALARHLRYKHGIDRCSK